MSVHNKQSLINSISHVEGWLSDHEAILLYELAHKIKAPGDIVEIGSYKGKSTISLAYGLQMSGNHRTIWAVDPHEGVIRSESGKTHGNSLQNFKENIDTSGISSVVHPLVMTSRKAAKEWKGNICLLFIDGLHDETHTHEDYQLWSGYVSQGGVIAFHDAFCGEPGVWNVVNKYVFRRKDIIDIGTVASILYVILGKPSIYSKIRVARKKALVRFAYAIHSKRIPWLIKKYGIHVGIRLLLLTRYTRGVYKRS